MAKNNIIAKFFVTIKSPTLKSSSGIDGIKNALVRYTAIKAGIAKMMAVLIF